MNILFIGTTDIRGGAASVSWAIKSFLEREGHQVSMFVADKRSDDPNVKIIPRVFSQKLLSFLFSDETFIHTDWILETKEFKEADVIHCHNLHGRFFNLETLGKMAKLKPVVWTLHDEWALTPHCACTLQGTEMKNGLYVCPGKDTPPRVLWENTDKLVAYKNRVYKDAHFTVVSPSLWLKERAQKTALGGQEIVHIPNGIDTSIFVQSEQRSAREQLNLPLEKKIILFLAEGAKTNIWKGWEYAEAAMKRLSSDDRVLFVCVGSDEEYEDEPHVIYRKKVSDKVELSRYYSAADAFVLTSVAENFPLVVLEAMSCGAPVVSFDVGGVREVVLHKENGYVAEYRNVDDLIEGIKWVLGLPAESLKQIALTSREKIKMHYDLKEMVESYVALYSRLLKK